MSEEVRTTSRTGGQKGVKPERFSLLPKLALDAIARVYAFGEQKYAAHNWRRRYEWSKSYDSIIRHVTAFWEGETYDPESGLPHLAHAAFHIFALLTWCEEQGEGGEFDDRYRPEVGPPTPDGRNWTLIDEDDSCYTTLSSPISFLDDFDPKSALDGYYNKR